MTVLSEILSSRVRAKIFQLLFGAQFLEIHMRGLQRRSGFAIGTVQAELGKLVRLGLVEKRVDGNRTYFKANENNLLFPDIRRLVLKTDGLVGLLRDTIKGKESIQLAFVFGSIASGQVSSESDIDLMVIGRLGLRELSPLLSRLQETVGREINPHLYSPTELRKRLQNQDHFVQQVLEGPKLFVTGSEDDLRTMAR
jgi:predicted nucleotidyltransferase